MLDAAQLAFGDLSRYKAVVVGVRAYELRHDLPGANQRLLDYVSTGERLSCNTSATLRGPRAVRAVSGEDLAARNPLPRVTDETSPVKFLKPDIHCWNGQRQATT